jgi:hypothetical protein
MIVNSFVQISWTDPSTNGAALTGYLVYIADWTGTYNVENNYCNGLSNPIFT